MSKNVHKLACMQTAAVPVLVRPSRADCHFSRGVTNKHLRIQTRRTARNFPQFATRGPVNRKNSGLPSTDNLTCQIYLTLRTCCATKCKQHQMSNSNSAAAAPVTVVSDLEIVRAMRKQPSMVYCLQSKAVAKSTATYIGFTVNPYRRLRQHNGEVSAGARRTSQCQPWRFIAIVCGFPAHVAGLQFEWACA